MARILIAPFSRPLSNGKPNPKNWPHWYALVTLLECAGNELAQCGEEHETRVCGVHVGLLSKETVIADIQTYDLCLCVDTWLQHAAVCAGVPAVVIWTATDPIVFGHADNVNVTAITSRFAKEQYTRMECIADTEPGVFPGPTPEMVFSAIQKALKDKE